MGGGIWLRFWLQRCSPGLRLRCYWVAECSSKDSPLSDFRTGVGARWLSDYILGGLVLIPSSDINPSLSTCSQDDEGATLYVAKLSLSPQEEEQLADYGIY